MKIATIALTSMLLSGCSVVRASYQAPPPMTNKMIHFVELMEFVRDNHHVAPTPEIKAKVYRLMTEASLVQQCANRRCWLAYGDLKITTEELFINIEYRDKNVIKIDINEPEKAARVVYGY